MAKIIVTGGAGYIGSMTSAALIRRGHTPVIVDNLFTGHRRAVPPGIEFHHVDLANATKLTEVFAESGCEGVIHFAALTQVGESVRKPFQYWETNLIGTKNLLQAMASAGMKKLIFSSTAATYGNPAGELVEDHPKKPINPYGHSKLAMEYLIEDAAGTGAFRGIALRYFNACGAAPDGEMGEDHAPESHLIPLVMAAGLGMTDPARAFTGRVTIFGEDYPTPDGTCVRDYINVLDLADAHIKAFESLQEERDGYFDAFNVGTGSGNSVREVITTAEEVISAHSGKGDFKLPAVMGERRAGDPAKLVANSDKIQKRLGWKPRYSLRDSVESVYGWMTKHPHGYGDREAIPASR